MKLYLEIISGELRGSVHPVFDGLVIGRRECDVTIGDPKISSKHARIEGRSDGSYWIIDLDSANGTKFGGKRRTTALLEPGVEFVLGSTQMRVISREAENEQDADLDSSAVVLRPSDPNTPEVNHSPGCWDRIASLVDRAMEAASSGTHEPRGRVSAFAPPLRLKIISGPQTGLDWFVGYGPRAVGSGIHDLFLSDSNLPAHCFTLIPQDRGVAIAADAATGVRINGRSTKWTGEPDDAGSMDVLKNGDIIELAGIQIRVSFDE